MSELLFEESTVKHSLKLVGDLLSIRVIVMVNKDIVSKELWGCERPSRKA